MAPPTAPTSAGTVRPTRELASTYATGDKSYADLAAAVGCSKALVGQIIAEGQPTSIERAEAIADALGAPVSRLFRHKNGDPIGGA